MKTTLVLPDRLLKQAMKITRMKTKTGVIVYALQNLLHQENVRAIKNYRGKLHLDIPLSDLRNR